jgi:prophage regulatory protein
MNTTNLNSLQKELVNLDRGIKEAECAAITGLSRHYRWKLERLGRFPIRRRVGYRCHYWLLSEIHCWLQDPENYPASAKL